MLIYWPKHVWFQIHETECFSLWLVRGALERKKNVPPPLDKFLTTPIDPLPLKHKNYYKSSTKPVNGLSERDHEVLEYLYIVQHEVLEYLYIAQQSNQIVLLVFFSQFSVSHCKRNFVIFQSVLPYFASAQSAWIFFLENILLYPLPKNIK